MHRLASIASFLLGSALASSVTGCAVGNDPPEDPDVRPATASFRLRADGDREWVMRVSRDGDRIEGKVMRVAGSGTSASPVPPGVVTGTMPARGKIKLTIEPPGDVLGTPAAPAQPLAFEGLMLDGGLEGTLRMANEDRYIVLVPVTIGAVDDRGGPLAAEKLVSYVRDDCAVDVVSLEFFGLEPTLETKLNAIGDTFASRAAEACIPERAVHGSVRVSFARPDAISLAAETVLPTAEEQPTENPRARYNVALETGNELRLFGDILIPGSESALAAAFDTVVSAYRPDALADDSRATLRHLLRSELDEGTLRFGIVDRGLVFDVPEIKQPHVTSVFVSFAALQSALQPSWR